MSQTIVEVPLDESTHNWLLELAKANNVQVCDLLAQAAFCFADNAGRREGSWEASAARAMLVSSGYAGFVDWDGRKKLWEWEEKRNAAHRGKVGAA